jgi:hypothetical protein
VEEAKERLAARPFAPALLLEPVSDNEFEVCSPHSDLAAWEVQMAAAFGTRSFATFETFIAQLRDLCDEAWDEGSRRWKPSEAQLNAAVNIINGSRPENELQAALAAQMVASHWMAMRLSSKALHYPGDERTASAASRVMRAFAQQAETLSKLQGKSTQSKQEITVRQEKHVHHHQHVHLGGGEQAIGGQPYEPGRATEGGRAGEPEGRSSLPSSDAAGNVLPLSLDAGANALPIARRQGNRRSEG